MRRALSRSVAIAMLLGLCMSLGFHQTAFAIQPGEMLTDRVLEQRARDIGKDLRCLVCQNQSIDDSDADLAHDLRVLVRQRILAGDSDAQVKQYVVDRYGDYVLLKPPLMLETILLWAGPLALFLCAIGLAVTYYRRRTGSIAAAPLSADESRRVADLLQRTAKDDEAPQ